MLSPPGNGGENTGPVVCDAGPGIAKHALRKTAGTRTGVRQTMTFTQVAGNHPDGGPRRLPQLDIPQRNRKYAQGLRFPAVGRAGDFPRSVSWACRPTITSVNPRRSVQNVPSPA